MGIDEGIYGFLSTIPELIKLLTAPDSSDIRIYQDMAPAQTPYPFVCFSITGDKDEGRHMGGGSQHKHAQVELDVWATDQTTRGTIRDILYNKLHGLHHVSFGESFALQSMTCLNELSLKDPPVNASDITRFRKKMMFSMFYFDSATPELS